LEAKESLPPATESHEEEGRREIGGSLILALQCLELKDVAGGDDDEEERESAAREV